MLPFVSEEYEAHLAIMMIWWWWWLIRERAYDSNIRKILKCFQKQSLWWEHRNILENCAITLCWGETSSKLCIVVKTELSLLCGLAPAKTSASWVNNSIRLHTLKRDIFLAQFFSKNFRLFLRIKMMLFLIKILSRDDDWFASGHMITILERY